MCPLLFYSFSLSVANPVSTQCLHPYHVPQANPSPLSCPLSPWEPAQEATPSLSPVGLACHASVL
jgi:hypothetical protein